MAENIIYKDKTDEELVRLTLRDQEIFAYLIERYKNKLIRFILRITKVDLDEAEDILQNVFIKVYKNLNDFDTDLKFSSWIYRITRNETISQHRKNMARPQKYTLDLEDNLIKNVASEIDIEREMDVDFLKDHIEEILEKLDDKYREVLVLKFLEEKSYEEISDIIKKPMGTVASLINRAKKQFREKLDKPGLKI